MALRHNRKSSIIVIVPNTYSMCPPTTYALSDHVFINSFNSPMINTFDHESDYPHLVDYFLSYVPIRHIISRVIPDLRIGMPDLNTVSRVIALAVN